MNKDAYESLRVLLYERRIALGLSQTEVAKRIGCSQRYYSLYESGQRPFTAKRLAEVMVVLKPDLSTLWESASMEDTAKLLQRFYRLRERDRELLLQIADLMIEQGARK